MVFIRDVTTALSGPYEDTCVFLAATQQYWDMYTFSLSVGSHPGVLLGYISPVDDERLSRRCNTSVNRQNLLISITFDRSSIDYYQNRLLAYKSSLTAIISFAAVSPPIEPSSTPCRPLSSPTSPS